MHDMTTTGKNTFSKKIKTVLTLTLCCVFLVTALLIFAACGNGNDYETFAEAQSVAATEGKPVLLYISKKPCPYCNKFKPEWQEAKKQYGDRVIFYVSTINVDDEADELFEKYAKTGRGVLTGSPGLVWLDKDGKVIDKATGLDQSKSKIWGYFKNGLDGWWTDVSRNY